MARNVSVVVTDDLDGSDGAKPVAFSLDGVRYEIDLAQPNKARLADALAPYIAAGRKVTGPGRRHSSTPRAQRTDRTVSGPGPARQALTSQNEAGSAPISCSSARQRTSLKATVGLHPAPARPGVRNNPWRQLSNAVFSIDYPADPSSDSAPRCQISDDRLVRSSPGERQPRIFKLPSKY